MIPDPDPAHEIKRALDEIGGFRPSRTTIRSQRPSVREHPVDFHVHVRDVVDAGQHPRADERRMGSGWANLAPKVMVVRDTEAENPTILVEGHFGLAQLVAPVEI